MIQKIEGEHASEMITFKMTMKKRIDGNVKITIATSIDAFSTQNIQ